MKISILPLLFIPLMALATGCQQNLKNNQASLKEPQPVPTQLFEEIPRLEKPRIAPTPAMTYKENPAPAVTYPKTAQTHIFTKTDSLWKLATKYYGDGKRWREILQANPGIKNQYSIQVGQKIIIP